MFLVTIDNQMYILNYYGTSNPLEMLFSEFDPFYFHR